MIHYNCFQLNQSSHYVNDGLIEIEMLPYLENINIRNYSYKSIYISDERK